MRPPAVIIFFLLLGAALLWSYFATRLPPGIEAKGAAESLMPWVKLAGACVSLLIGVAGLTQRLIDIRLKLAEARAKGR